MSYTRINHANGSVGSIESAEPGDGSVVLKIRVRDNVRVEFDRRPYMDIRETEEMLAREAAISDAIRLATQEV